jgi:hypothetical protein
MLQKYYKNIIFRLHSLKMFQNDTNFAIINISNFRLESIYQRRSLNWQHTIYQEM